MDTSFATAPRTNTPAVHYADFNPLTKDDLVAHLRTASGNYPPGSHDHQVILYTLATVALIEAWHNWHRHQDAPERHQDAPERLNTLWQAEDEWRRHRNLSPHSIHRIRLEHKAWLVFHHTCSLSHIESHIPRRKP